MPHLMQDIWKRTVVKSQINATNMIMPQLRQAILWKLKLKWRWSVAINAVMQKAIWADIWKFIQGKSHTSAANATLHLFMQGIWGNTWKDTLEKKCTHAKGHTSATNAMQSGQSCHQNSLWWKAIQVQPMQLRSFSEKQSRHSSQNSHWWKATQVQPMRIRIWSQRRSGPSYENSHWRTDIQKQNCPFSCNDKNSMRNHENPNTRFLARTVNTKLRIMNT